MRRAFNSAMLLPLTISTVTREEVQKPVRLRYCLTVILAQTTLLAASDTPAKTVNLWRTRRLAQLF